MEVKTNVDQRSPFILSNAVNGGCQAAALLFLASDSNASRRSWWAQDLQGFRVEPSRSFTWTGSMPADVRTSGPESLVCGQFVQKGVFELFFVILSS